MKFAGNKDYFAVSYWGQTLSGDSSFLAVFNRAGTLLSASPSPKFADITFDEQNNLWGLTAPIAIHNLDSNTEHPDTVTQMDLYQNIIRKKAIGRPYVVANKISINNGTVIVSGTLNTSLAFGRKSPDKLYFYKESIGNIPRVEPQKSLCNAVIAYPNPVSSELTITSFDYNATSTASLCLTNTLGEKVAQSALQSKQTILPMASLPTGIYYLRIADNSAQCVYKILKQ